MSVLITKVDSYYTHTDKTLPERFLDIIINNK